MSDSSDPWIAIEQILKLFYPQYFDPADPAYVDNVIMQQLDIIAQQARPWCLNNDAQNLAEAMYLAYLISLRHQTTSGSAGAPPAAGPVLSEKEGDISVTYADMTKSGASTASLSQRPASDPWDMWNKLWQRCASGGITTRYGDPCRAKSGIAFTNEVTPYAVGVWRQMPYVR